MANPKIPYDLLGMEDPHAPDPYQGMGPNDPRASDRDLRIIRDLLKKKRGPNFRGPWEFPEDNSDLSRRSEEDMAGTIADLQMLSPERQPAAGTIPSMFGNRKKTPKPDVNPMTLEASPDVLNQLTPRPSSPAAEAPPTGRDAAAKYFINAGPLKPGDQIPGGFPPSAEESPFESITNPVMKYKAPPQEQPLEEAPKENPLLEGIGKLTKPEDELSFFKDPAKMQQFYKLMNSTDLGPYMAYLDSIRGKGSHLSDMFKHKSTLEAQVAQDKRQQERLSEAAGKDYMNQLEKDYKPLRDIVESSSAIRSNLTPTRNARGELEVNLGKAKAIIAKAAHALGNVGMQTENDATRTLAMTLQMQLGTWLTYVTSDPSYTVGYDQVKNLLETINAVGEAAREEVSNKVHATRDSFVVGRSLHEDKADAVLAPYLSLLEKSKGAFALPDVQGVSAPTKAPPTPTQATPTKAPAPTSTAPTKAKRVNAAQLLKQQGG